MGVVTNLPEWFASPLLQSLALAHYFGILVGYQWGRAKPHPYPIELALRNLRPPDTVATWYVGDGPTDAEAASRAGVHFAWASYGYFTTAPPEAESLLSGFEDVLNL